MPWIIAACVLLPLTLLFIASARLIRRDLNDRFHGVQIQLEHAANGLVDLLIDEHR
jgi:hypothetical protein